MSDTYIRVTDAEGDAVYWGDDYYPNYPVGLLDHFGISSGTYTGDDVGRDYHLIVALATHLENKEIADASAVAKELGLTVEVETVRKPDAERERVYTLTNLSTKETARSGNMDELEAVLRKWWTIEGELKDWDATNITDFLFLLSSGRSTNFAQNMLGISVQTELV